MASFMNLRIQQNLNNYEYNFVYQKYGFCKHLPVLNLILHKPSETTVYLSVTVSFINESIIETNGMSIRYVIIHQ